jgi:manganese transport protein
LVVFTGDSAKMGVFVNGRLLRTTSWVVTAIIILLNMYLLLTTFFPAAA